VGGTILKRHSARVLFAVCAWVSATAPTLVGGPAGIDAWGTVRAGHRPEPNAVVWLDAPGEGTPPPSRTAVLDQRNQSFYPHVLVVRTGTTVELPNNDRVFHNVFSFHNGKRFDLGLYPVGTSKRVVFDRPGLSRIFCNIHPNMAAYVMAVDSPYFAVSDEAGRFHLTAVPPGLYRYHAWRASGPELEGSLAIEAGRSIEIGWP
jgi:plastocyanin